MRLAVAKFSAEYGDCGSHTIVLDVELMDGEAARFASEVTEGEVAVLNGTISRWMDIASKRAAELNDMKERIRKVGLLYDQRTAGVLHADQVATLLGIEVEGGPIDLCNQRGSKNCPDLGCARRVYATGAACHPAEGKDLVT